MTVFLSCSFHEEDGKVIDLVTAVLAGFGLTHINVSTGSPRTPPEEAIALLRRADIVVAIGTRRHRLEGGGFKMPDAVHGEITMAYTLGKPILLLLEEGVRPEGFVGNYGTYLSFDRTRLTAPSFIQRLVGAIDTLASSQLVQKQTVTIGKYEAGATKEEASATAIAHKDRSGRSHETTGVLAVYQSRSQALDEFLPHLKAEHREIMIVGSSLRGLLQELEWPYENARTILRDKLADGVRVRILMTHPAVADLRAQQEGRDYGDIGTEIINSLQMLTTDWKADACRVKLYLGTPTLFGIKTSDAMLLNPYPYMREAVGTPTIIVDRHGYIYDAFAASHFNAWHSALAVTVPEDSSAFQSRLYEYARNIRLLLEEARKGAR